jgi:hypothetical protein
MTKQVDSDTYAAVLASLEEQPVLTWACDIAGVSRQSVYVKLKEDPEFAVNLAKAKAKGQAKRLPGVSDERVLSWSDREAFGLRDIKQVEGDVTINVSAKLADRVS